ncbi:twin-arginine translocase subunit TatC [Streptomyces lonarensis]|uniref:Sec-independent protein translocase protein TatC n=1 Tax=Streptomyces lonarensis TaxID=700599 RepID=A0A7X6D1H8_9ACTN|nr:twin-arginine translocase subunit TatC [Streptomyces lonarensis]NJQ06364.1 twin-arginine translocase subunit TatC [Streptomyces lonarensis]
MLKAARNGDQRKEKPQRDPEGRMSLVEHLRELRNRLAIGVLAIFVVTVVAMFFAKDIMALLTDPLPNCLEEEPGSGRCADLVQQGLTSPFTTYVKVSLFTGLVLASPVWLYQLWAFIAPGLHQNEKRYSAAVVAFGAPLFLTGVYVAHWLLPRAIPVLLQFTPDNAGNLVTVSDLLDITVRLAIAFGFAFELPLVLVMLNLGGVVSGRRMLGWWRGMVMGIAIFAAIVTPTDPMSMLALAVPVTALYFVATGIALLNDRRRGRAAGPELSDDEASDLDLTPEPIDAPGRVTPPRSPGDGGPRRGGGFDDVT